LASHPIAHCFRHGDVRSVSSVVSPGGAATYFHVPTRKTPKCLARLAEASVRRHRHTTPASHRPWTPRIAEGNPKHLQPIPGRSRAWWAGCSAKSRPDHMGPRCLPPCFERVPRSMEKSELFYRGCLLDLLGLGPTADLARLVRERTSALLAPRSNPARLLRLKCRGS
jgi:hypothetical protein